MLVLPFGEESDMSISTNSLSSLRQSDLHASVERQGLALGAAREQAFRAASLLREHERRDEAAADNWENEGGRLLEELPRHRRATFHEGSAPCNYLPTCFGMTPFYVP